MNYLYNSGDCVRHSKTGHVYKIVAHCKIESTCENAYLYTRANGRDGFINWVRPASEMEDGRFRLCFPDVHYVDARSNIVDSREL